MKTLLAALLLFALSCIPAHAEDGLYPAAPPPGSAFIRFINGDATPAPAALRGKSYPAAGTGEIGAYFPAPPGDAPLKLGAASASKTLEPGKYYSATLARGKLTVQEEPAFTNKLKTQLILLNLSAEKDVSLKTADGLTAIVDPVAPGALGARAVNPVKAAFSVYAGDKKIADLPARPLERGAGYAIVVTDGPEGKPAVTYDKAGTP